MNYPLLKNEEISSLNSEKEGYISTLNKGNYLKHS
jgi:hypothetical protein